MMVLPRNPTEMPAKVLSSQSVMQGRSGSNHSSKLDGTSSEKASKFAFPEGLFEAILPLAVGSSV